MSGRLDWEKQKYVLAIYWSDWAKPELTDNKKRASCNGLIPYDQWLWREHKNAFQCLKYCFTATSSKTFQIISFTKNCLALIEKASCIHCFQVYSFS